MENLKCMFLLDKKENAYETCKLIKKLLKFTNFNEFIFINDKNEEFFSDLLLKFQFNNYFKFLYEKNLSHLLITNKIFDITNFLISNENIDVLIINNYSEFSLNASLAAFKNNIPVIKIDFNFEEKEINFRNIINKRLLNQIVKFYININSDEDLIFKNLTKIKNLKKGCNII